MGGSNKRLKMITENLQTIAQALEIANKAGAYTLSDSATIAVALQNLTNEINELTNGKDSK